MWGLMYISVVKDFLYVHKALGLIFSTTKRKKDKQPRGLFVCIYIHTHNLYIILSLAIKLFSY